MAEVATKADPGATGWAIRDDVARLRVFGTEQVYELTSATRWILGSAADCSIRLDDKSGRVSRRHAAIERTADGWLLSDLGSTNGIRIDGEDRKSSPLAPGIEIELGGTKLVAESARSIALRELLERFVGWAPARSLDVDHALRAVREMANLRASLVVRGDGSLLGVVHRLHRMVLGDEQPLVAHDPKEPGTAALDRAKSGMLYLDAEHLPSDLQLVTVGLRLPDARVRLVVGASTREATAEIAMSIPHVATISISPLSERQDEIDRLLDAYANDATRQLGADGTGLRPHDLRWIRESGIATHEQADEAMIRIVAMRNWGVTGGAERLGITHGALSRWARRRKIPT